MVGEDTVTMSAKELRRVHVLRQVREKRITQREAGAMLQLTDRQIRRLLTRVTAAGDEGLVHRGRGRLSNRRISETKKTKVLTLYAAKYADFGPTLAAEKLAERHRLIVSAETLRGELGKRTSASWCSWMDRTMTGWRGAARAVSCWPTLMMPAAGCLPGSMRTKERFPHSTVFSGTFGSMEFRWPSMQTSIRRIVHPLSRLWRSNWPGRSPRVSLGVH